ncbi:AmmeMemoRadiSam system protein A [Nannocystis sp.]|uniref:AmmeMemoRadiSam system protein A n=1 Tax=Nannocystis sp. TaxID=1962667 RepID=UPI0025F266B4|nr:AmmeMemoRadiSam system protein A [Nannocystis sp.]
MTDHRRVEAPPMTDHRGPILLALARSAITAALGGPALIIPDAAFLAAPGACFVSLHRDGQLRGCIGNILPVDHLRDAITHNAVAAALRDSRFTPLRPHELADTTIDISLLSPLSPLPAHSEAALLAALRPGVDGLRITSGNRGAVFIPSVWEQLPDPRAFLDHLRAKAGLPRDRWPADMHADRFTAEHFKEQP